MTFVYAETAKNKHIIKYTCITSMEIKIILSMTCRSKSFIQYYQNKVLSSQTHGI